VRPGEEAVRFRVLSLHLDGFGVTDAAVNRTNEGKLEESPSQWTPLTQKSQDLASVVEAHVNTLI
jgi:hypothetical protein